MDEEGDEDEDDELGVDRGDDAEDAKGKFKNVGEHAFKLCLLT